MNSSDLSAKPFPVDALSEALRAFDIRLTLVREPDSQRERSLLDPSCHAREDE
jgi:hypothetical protein